MRIGVVTFPGSNCDQDTLDALDTLGVDTLRLWYRDADLAGADAVVLPGGFSYGDYLRSGALAAKSPIMTAIQEAVVDRQLPLLGICNGFQILTEAGLLPGGLRANHHGQFRCDWQRVKVIEASPLFPGLEAGEVLKLPIAHGEGSYYMDEESLQSLFAHGEAWLQYVDADGQAQSWANPNGSVANLAGVARGSVAALMPHPERAMMDILGSDDGHRLLTAWLCGLERRALYARG